MDIRAIIKLVLYPFAFIATLITKMFWPDYPDDNIIEECAEIVIQQQTGQDVDLTPNSPEKK